ncbi:MAG: hypothetical protein R3D71_05770 [Rickettsiales bacterium]
MKKHYMVLNKSTGYTKSEHDNNPASPHDTSLQEFVWLVEKMRGSQKEYFKTRNGDALNRARQLESEVDRFIKDYRQGVLL